MPTARDRAGPARAGRINPNKYIASLHVLDDPVDPVPRTFEVVGDPSVEGDREPRVGPGFDGLRPETEVVAHLGDAVPAEDQAHALAGQQVGGLFEGVDTDQPTERLVDVTPRQVEPDRSDHGRPGLGDVDATRDEPAADHLDQQGMDAVARGHRVLGAVVGRDPADQQPGGLEVHQHVGGLGVVGEVYGEPGRDHALGGHAEQDVPLPTGECREHFAGHPVGDGGVAGRQPVGGGDRIGRGAHCAGGQHHDRAPALRVRGHSADHVGVGRAGVFGDQRGALRVAHPQQLAPQDREVAEQFRQEPGQRQVPARDQEHP